MPIQTDLSVSPYFDDYDVNRDYYKILFQPSVPVQVRELNQLQTILQKQIERFGDHIVKRGSIINGCQFTFHPSIPYVKLKDATAKGTAAVPANYEGLLVKNSANLVARVVSSNTGFESQDPKLKTLYLNYLNSGNTKDKTAYSAAETLTVYSSNKRLYSVSIGNASQGFSNNDSVVILSSIEVQNTSGGTSFANGSFQVGETLTQDTTLAEAVITSVNTTANSDAIVLQIRPVTSQLIQANTDSWSWGKDYNFTSDITGNEGVVAGFVGSGATASLLTTGAGAIANVTVVTGGSNYYVDPYVTVSTTSASSAQVGTLNLTGNAYLANVVVASVSNPVGSAYGVTISEGTVYQKGYFLRSDEQFIIIDRYANTPNAISVGFTTQETIANSAIDNSLVDNASGFLNYNAPGANRLKLTPVLSVKTNEEAEEDPEFLSLVKFSEGKYFFTSAQKYDNIGEEFATRTYEESGNYVLDKFNMTTRSTLAIANSDTHFSYVIDPGHAYINGYRVKTDRNFATDVSKGTQTLSLSNTVFDIVYGNYVLVNEFSGVHAFTIGQQVSLRDTAIQYITNSPSSDVATVSLAGSAEIGKARVRGVMYHGGSDQGTPGAIYRLYLFDIRMNAGKNFVSVRSILADNATGLDGIADVKLETTTGAGGAVSGAVLKLKEYNSLLIDTGKPLASAANVDYQYRTTFENIVIGTTGVSSAIAQKTNSLWTYSGALSSFEENEILVIPEENLISTQNVGTDTITFNDSTGALHSNNSVFTASQSAGGLEAGDYIYVSDGSNTAIARVVSITDDENLIFSPVNAFSAIGESTAEIFRCYPKGIPVPISRRQAATATVSGTNLTLNLDIDMAATANVTLIANQRFTGTATTPVGKTATRNLFVKIDTSTNVAGENGPWCLGYSDVIRLRKVYLGSTTSDEDITHHFYINNKQNKNYYDLSELVISPNSTFSANASMTFLVEFDYTAHDREGVKSISSYTINDEVSLSSLTTDINTMEIPEFIDVSGNYIDTRTCIDFRPATANTVTATTNPATAPTNPALPIETSRFSGSDLFFPVPEGDMFCNISWYLGRKDLIILNSDGRFEILEGTEKADHNDPSKLTLYSATIPPYPSVPKNLSDPMRELIKTRMNPRMTSQRASVFAIQTEAIDKQLPGYTMEEIGQLERRILALEYYANISELENEVKNKVIPSSVDSTLDRFKFGFFVENFADLDHADYMHNEFNTSVYEFNMHPSRDQYDVELMVANTRYSGATGGFLGFNDGLITPNYSKKTILSQKNITAGAVIVPTPPPIIVGPPDPGPNTEVVVPEQNTTPIDANTTIGNTCIFVNSSDRTYSNYTSGTYNPYYQDSVFTLSANVEADQRDITIDFNVFSGKDRIEIYQSQYKDRDFTLIYTNETLTPTNLTNSRKVYLNNQKFEATNLNPNTQRGRNTTAFASGGAGFDFGGRWLKDLDWSYTAQGANTDYWIKGVGRMTFKYDFTNGQYIKVRVVKGSPIHSYYICFPGDVRTFDTVVLDDGVTVPKNVVDTKPSIVKPKPRPTKRPIRKHYRGWVPKPVITHDTGVNKCRPSTVPGTILTPYSGQVSQNISVPSGQSDPATTSTTTNKLDNAVTQSYYVANTYHAYLTNDAWKLK